MTARNDSARPVAGPEVAVLTDALRVLAFGACGLLVSAKADGRFPFPDSLSETVFQLALLPYTLALCAAVAVFLMAPQLTRALSPRLPRRLITVPPLTYGLGVGLFFAGLTLVVLRLETRQYSSFGYALPPRCFTALGLLVALLCAWLVLRRRTGAWHMLLVAASVYAAAQLASLVYFPLHPGRSDMLPLIAAACRRFCDGQSPYGLHLLPHAVPLTYLPGTWLAFAPAVCAHLDPRLIHVLGTLAATGLLYMAAARERRATVAVLAALFLLMPYLEYRHELYLGPLWLALALLTLCLARGRALAAGLAMGWACASSQFAWILLPAFGACVWRTCGARRAASALAAVAAVAGVLVAPFALWAPEPFFQGVFGHWGQTLNATTANLSFFIARALRIEGLRAVQWSTWVGLTLLLTRRLRSAAGFFSGASVLLGAFVLLNSVVWVYFYLTVFFLMIASVAAERSHLPETQLPGDYSGASSEESRTVVRRE